jgi:hypothetical protein
MSIVWAAVEDGRIVMTYHCPALADEVVCNGLNAESGFLYLSRFNSTFVKVYQAWRYESKHIGTEQSPMTRDVIAEAAEDMKAIQFTNAQQVVVLRISKYNQSSTIRSGSMLIFFCL